MIKIITLLAVLFVSGCYDDLPYYYEPCQPYQPTNTYNSVERRIENLERNAREMEIGKRFPGTAAQPYYGY